MKKSWTIEELQKFWTISPDERSLLNIKTGVQKFFFILLLKYYINNSSFPINHMDIPLDLLDYGYRQFNIIVSNNELENLFLNIRNCNRYKAKIRAFLGITIFKSKEKEQLIQHLHKLAFETRSAEKLNAESKIYLKQHKIESPTDAIINNLVRILLHKFDDYLFKHINAIITQKQKNYIDNTILHKNKDTGETILSFLKQDSGKSNRDSILVEINKLTVINLLNLDNSTIPENISQSVLKFYKRKILSDTPEQIRVKPDYIKYPLIVIYCYLKHQEIIDNLVDHLVNFIHKIKKKANKTEFILNDEISKLNQIMDSLYQVAEVARDKPNDIIQDAIYPVVPKEQIEAIIKARYLLKNLKKNVQNKVIQSYSSYYRKVIFDILINLNINSDNIELLTALELIKKHQHNKGEFDTNEEDIIVEGLVNAKDIEFIRKINDNEKALISRKDYEYAVFKVLRDKLKTKEVWVANSFKYRDPERETPKDFEENKSFYYGILNQPLSAEEFNQPLKKKLANAITNFDKNLPKNKYVNITTRKNKPWITLSPLPEQPKPQNLDKLKDSIISKWNIINLLDTVKEVDLRENFTDCFNSSGNREIISKEDIQKRLILCLFAIGTNAGLGRISSSSTNRVSIEELKYIKRKFINQDDLREAITKVVNGIFRIRDAAIWGEATTACAADSRKFTSWDQNLMTKWHARYHGAGVMIYWHVTKQSICIHSQLKTCSSSEVASMLQGVISQDTDMSIESQYVDSHGKSEVGFVLTYLLGFDLLPRYATVGPQKIYLPFEELNCKNISDITTRPINWELISTHYNSMIKYAAALKICTATADSIIRQFSRSNYQHPIFKAFIELGRAVKSIFLCRYLDSLELRKEIHSGLNIVENWNSVNSFIFYGKKSEINSKSRDEQEYSMLCLHLLQVCLAYVNTLLIQDILSTNAWKGKLIPEDLRGLTPLIYQHINPYGTFELDMLKRILLSEAA
jgi:TnpA family transposase